MRKITAAVCDIAGCAALTTGAAMISPAAGWIAGGACALWYASYVDRAGR